MTGRTPEEDLRQLVRLARLRPSDLETQPPGTGIAQQVAQLLRHFAVLQQVDTAGVEPSAYPLPIPHRMRADEPADPLSQAEVLAGAPARRAGCFLVPRVVLRDAEET